MSSVGIVIARMNTPVPRHIAWKHLVDPRLRGDWWAELQLDAKLGGSVTERHPGHADVAESDEGAKSDENAESDETYASEAVGKVDVMVEGHALGFRWRDLTDAYDTEVLITLRSNESGTGITVTETGFGRFMNGSERVATSQQGWIALLTSFVGALSMVDYDPEDVALQAAAAAQPLPASEPEIVSDPEVAAEPEAAAEPVQAEVDATGDAAVATEQPETEQPEIEAEQSEPVSHTSEIEVVPPVAEGEVEDSEAVSAPEELEVEAEKPLAELVAEASIVQPESLRDVLEDGTVEDEALEVEAEPEAVEITIDTGDPDFDELLRGL